MEQSNIEVDLQDKPAPDIFATIPKEETATIIIPLYEMVKDGLVPSINYQMLEVALLRLRSYFHKTYLVFVIEKERTTDEALQVVSGHLAARNTVVAETEAFSTFGMYLRSGLDAALTETQSKYFIIATPWQMVGSNTVDIMLERTNKGDLAIVSAFDTRVAVPSIGYNPISPAEFDNVKFNPPRDFHGVNLDLFAMTRTIADMFVIDPAYKTREMLQRDVYQLMTSKGLDARMSQQAPIYTFEFDWSSVEGEEEFAEDRGYFQKKWGFTPA